MAALLTLLHAGQTITGLFHKAGWGIFVHYLEDLQNNPAELNSLGKRTSWDECVKEFDTEKFAEQIAQTSAGYVIFTMHQRTRFLIAPNATFDRLSGYQPGAACATRDLVLDLHASLAKRGIRLMLYWTGDGPREDPQAAKALGWSEKVSEDYVRHWAAVAREYGERYKDKVAGWWCDGCYPWIGYEEKRLGILGEALKAGSPQRIIALNVGVQDKVRAYRGTKTYHRRAERVQGSLRPLGQRRTVAHLCSSAARAKAGASPGPNTPSSNWPTTFAK